MSTTIAQLTAREILDSRGNPTVEVTCTLDDGTTATAAVPSGASTGVHEAVELRDKDPKRYNGLGVLNAVEHVSGEIAARVVGVSMDQTALDEALCTLDGTENKGRLGANAILGVSLAFAKAHAARNKQPLYAYIGGLANNTTFTLPQPMFNIINGGKHADSGLDIQEFMVIPHTLKTVQEKIRAGSEIVAALKKVLHTDGFSVGVGDEGGFAPKLPKNEDAVTYIEKAIVAAGYTTQTVGIGLDAAASSFYENGAYTFKIDGTYAARTSAELIAWYTQLTKEHTIISIEDGLAEDDWDGFTSITETLGSTTRIVGDDLTVTNVTRIKDAADKKAINAVLIKPNQIGSLTETIRAIQATKANGWVAIVSHRSGETMDTSIADIAVGLACEYIKTGAPVRGERVCKYNRLMEIEQELARG
jgi:enolase